LADKKWGKKGESGSGRNAIATRKIARSAERQYAVHLPSKKGSINETPPYSVEKKKKEGRA